MIYHRSFFGKLQIFQNLRNFRSCAFRFCFLATSGIKSSQRKLGIFPSEWGILQKKVIYYVFESAKMAYFGIFPKLLFFCFPSKSPLWLLMQLNQIQNDIQTIKMKISTGMVLLVLCKQSKKPSCPIFHRNILLLPCKSTFSCQSTIVQYNRMSFWKILLILIFLSKIAVFGSLNWIEIS